MSVTVDALVRAGVARHAADRFVAGQNAPATAATPAGRGPVAPQPRSAASGARRPASVTLTVPVPPSANAWHRHVGRRVLRSTAARAYLRELPAIVRAQLPEPWPAFPAGDLAIAIAWFRARAAGDVDKRGAILLDALQGLAYADDAQVVDYRIMRRDDEPRRARMVVTITPLGGAAA